MNYLTIAKWALVIVISAAGGMAFHAKVLMPEIPACPACNCPEPTVSVQPFDVDKIKGVKSFNYSPQFSGSISVAGVDSTALRKMIDRAIDQSLSKHVGKKIKK